MTRRSLFALAAAPLVKAAPPKEEPHLKASVIEIHEAVGLDVIPAPSDIRVWINGHQLPEAAAVDTRKRQVEFIIFDRIPYAVKGRNYEVITWPDTSWWRILRSRSMDTSPAP